MLTGQRAFDGDDVTDTLAAVVRHETVDWDALPINHAGQCGALLRRCLRRIRNDGCTTSRTRIVLEERIRHDVTAAMPDREVDPRVAPRDGRAAAAQFRSPLLRGRWLLVASIQPASGHRGSRRRSATAREPALTWRASIATSPSPPTGRESSIAGDNQTLVRASTSSSRHVLSGAGRTREACLHLARRRVGRLYGSADPEEGARSAAGPPVTLCAAGQSAPTGCHVGVRPATSSSPASSPISAFSVFRPGGTPTSVLTQAQPRTRRADPLWPEMLPEAAPSSSRSSGNPAARATADRRA